MLKAPSSANILGFHCQLYGARATCAFSLLSVQRGTQCLGHTGAQKTFLE